jgi:hypothetical protein
MAFFKTADARATAANRSRKSLSQPKHARKAGPVITEMAEEIASGPDETQFSRFT